MKQKGPWKGFDDWKRQSDAKIAAAKLKREEAVQPALSMPGIPVNVLCKDCGGRGCAHCHHKGVVEASVTTQECPRCYGLGSVSKDCGDGIFVGVACRMCAGTGQVLG